MSGGVITQKYGPEVQTIYSGNALNRLSFLREDYSYLRKAFHSPNARFLPFYNFNPLLKEDTHLEWLKLSDVADIVGDPYEKSVAEIAQNWVPERDASGACFAQVVFLGVDENIKEPEDQEAAKYSGAPRFAVDVTTYPHAKDSLQTNLEKVRNEVTSPDTVDFRSVMFGIELANPLDYNIIAEARIILDWINRTRYCGGCGSRNMSVWGGFKLLCPPSYAGRSECPTKGRVTNLSFPRTDTCVIAAVVSHDGSKVLIGRGKRFRVNMYSCLAGFLESGESIEDCVRREIFEEAGVKVGRVIMYASQPWPYPSNLMIGCVAEVVDNSEESHKINLGHDEELLDAKWVTKEDMQELCRGESTKYDFVVPPKTSVAWVLLDAASRGLV